MRQFYYYIYSFLLLTALAAFINYAHADGKKPVIYVHADGKKPSIPDTTRLTKVFSNKNDKSYLRNGIRVALPPLKPNVTIYGSNSRLNFPKFESDKLVSSVQVYPNPITDQINLRYNVTKNSNITIKIIDILGNEVMTLFSQRVDPGEQKFTFNLNNKLTSGFYFVRLVAGNGTESVIKRISIL
jgi:hypothetical protein